MAIDFLFKPPRAREMTTARSSSESPALFNMIHPLASSGNCTPVFLEQRSNISVALAVNCFIGSPSLELRPKTSPMISLSSSDAFFWGKWASRSRQKDSVTAFDLILLGLDMLDSFQRLATEQGIDVRSTSSFTQLVHSDYLVHSPLLPSCVPPGVVIVATEIANWATSGFRRSGVTNLRLKVSRFHGCRSVPLLAGSATNSGDPFPPWGKRSGASFSPVPRGSLRRTGCSKDPAGHASKQHSYNIYI